MNDDEREEAKRRGAEDARKRMEAVEAIFDAIAKGELDHDETATCIVCEAFLEGTGTIDASLPLLVEAAGKSCPAHAAAAQVRFRDAMVERRMRNTGETREEAIAAIEEATREMDRDADQSWVADWTRPGYSSAEHDATARWLATLPREVRALVIAFPPGATVRATKDLLIPKLGTVGVVTGYCKASERYPDGACEVRQRPDGKFGAHVEPRWLEVVGHRNGLTSEKVRALFAGELLS